MQQVCVHALIHYLFHVLSVVLVSFSVAVVLTHVSAMNSKYMYIYIIQNSPNEFDMSYLLTTQQLTGDSLETAESMSLAREVKISHAQTFLPKNLSY